MINNKEELCSEATEIISAEKENMSDENENPSDELHEKAKQEQLDRFRYCSAAVHFVKVEGTNYSVMSLFDRRDEQTAKDKLKYLIE